MSGFKGWTIKSVDAIEQERGELTRKNLRRPKYRKIFREKEDSIAEKLKEAGFEFERDYLFHTIRKWKFDFAIIEHKIAIEYEGGIYTLGRHTRGAGYAYDAIKYREAALCGWTVLRYTCDDIDCKVIYGTRGKKAGRRNMLWKCTGTTGIIDDVNHLIKCKENHEYNTPKRNNTKLK